MASSSSSSGSSTTSTAALRAQVRPHPTLPGEVEFVSKDALLSFDQGFFVAVKGIQLLRQHNRRTTIVSIAGPSGAGKTSIAKKIAEVIPKSLVVSLDNYLDGSRVVEENYDDYRLVDFELLVKNLTDLKEGRETDLPLYDFRRSGRYAYLHVPPPESRVVIVEGTYALHERVRGLVDLAISVSGGVHFDLVKRIFRDIQRTGQEPREVIQQITETAFIEPDLEKAHIRIVNSFNPFSGLLNPIYTLKSATAVPREKIEEVVKATLSSMGKTAKDVRTDYYYDIYLRPPGTNQHHNNHSNPEQAMYGLFVLLSCSLPLPYANNLIPEDKRRRRMADGRHTQHGLDWIRMRNNGGTYTLQFSESLKEDEFIIAPTMDFQVNVKILGGLMALGYSIAVIIHRRSIVLGGHEELSVTLDTLEELGAQTFVQIKGSSRQLVEQVGEKLGLVGAYIPKSYIEIYLDQFAPAPRSPAPATPAAAARGAGGLPSVAGDAALQAFVNAKL
ncbi:uridine kinase [Acanthamoeba castellanii str. Neff]|uniref:Uridine kinase n=1 Tax=Acanthamoeba castellanii (strain ATCC 30010 / Neff) TaxID=1257118 RepID=L8GQ88_ACACF|nr:uridine kinase [Acanthamoeba castellanii str. Neff]ELR15135.1 uridine kinase [Acanthamoeba castellanii str. Neff]